jgi:hypothetical protein
LPPQAGGLLDAVLDVAVLDKSREDHADLRLYDANGREVPYALRILRAVRSSDLFEANEFNRGLSMAAVSPTGPAPAMSTSVWATISSGHVDRRRVGAAARISTPRRSAAAGSATDYHRRAWGPTPTAASPPCAAGSMRPSAW